MAVCFVGAGILTFMARRNIPTVALKGLMILSVLCIGAAVSMLFSQDFTSSVPLLIRWLFLLSLAALAAIGASTDKGEEALVAMLVAAAFLQALWGNYLWWGGSGNILQGGTFYAPNQYAGFLLLLAPIPLSMALSSKSILRAILSASVAIVVYLGLFLSGSRWGILSATVSGAVLFSMLPANGARRLAAKRGTFVVAALLAVGWLFTPSSGGLQSDGLFQALESKAEWSDGILTRAIWAKQAVMIGLDSPVHGFGLGTFGDKHFQVMPVEQNWSQYAHNDYLQLFAEGGIIVAVPFLALTLLILLGCLRRSANVPAKEWSPGLSAGLVGGSLHALLDHDWTYPAFGAAFLVMAFIIFARSDGQALGTPPWKGRIWIIPVLLSLAGLILMSEAQRWDTRSEIARATSLSRSGSVDNLEQAQRLLAKAVESDRLDWSLRIHLSQVQEDLGEKGSARRSLVTAISLAPNSPEPYLQMGLFEKRNGRPRAARSYLLRGLSVVERSADRLYLTAQRTALEQALD